MAIYADINEVKDGISSYDTLRIDVYYDKGNWRWKRGIYLSLKPVTIEAINGIEIVSTPFHSHNARVNGITFLLEEIGRKNAKKEQMYANSMEKHKDEIAEAYNRFDKNELTSLVFSIC